jgi:hypothetical protein
MVTFKRIAIVAGASCLLAWPGVVAAQPPHGGEAKPATQPDPKAMEEARTHYERGLQLYQDEDYASALTEFERAYKLAPTPKILYNMARIQRHQNNYVAALTNYERYLREAGDAVPKERRAEVEKEIATLKPRTASVEITVNQPDAEVFVDDAPICAGMSAQGCVGKTPLPAPIVVNIGRRKISATKNGFAAAAQSINVAGSDSVKVQLDLQPITGGGPVDPAPRNRALVAWGVTAVLAGGAVGFGLVALGASKKVDDLRAQLAPDPDELKRQQDKMNTFAIVSDVFIGGAAIAGGIATYFTIKAFQAGKKSEEPESTTPQAKTKVHFDIGPTGALVHGTF